MKLEAISEVAGDFVAERRFYIFFFFANLHGGVVVPGFEHDLTAVGVFVWRSDILVGKIG